MPSSIALIIGVTVPCVLVFGSLGAFIYRTEHRRKQLGRNNPRNDPPPRPRIQSYAFSNRARGIRLGSGDVEDGFEVAAAKTPKPYALNDMKSALELEDTDKNRFHALTVPPPVQTHRPPSTNIQRTPASETNPSTAHNAPPVERSETALSNPPSSSSASSSSTHEPPSSHSHSPIKKNNHLSQLLFTFTQPDGSTPQQNQDQHDRPSEVEDDESRCGSSPTISDISRGPSVHRRNGSKELPSWRNSERIVSTTLGQGLGRLDAGRPMSLQCDSKFGAGKEEDERRQVVEGVAIDAHGDMF